MLDTSSGNPRISPYLRFVTAAECSVVLFAAVLLFFLPDLAKDLWAWDIPSFNARFVGAIYLAAYVPLFFFWYTARWTPGRFVLWMIFVFTFLIMVVMFVHWDAFSWNRLSTYLVFWPLYIFLPINSTIFLIKSRDISSANASETPAFWRVILLVFALFGGLYGFGLLFFPATFSSFWPWDVDVFHARIYASAFLTPVAGALLLLRRGAASEYLTLGLNLLLGGFLPILGTLWTNMTMSPDRQITFDLGTWMFFAMFLMAGGLGIIQLFIAFQKTK